MLLDKRVDALTAMGTSVALVWNNLPTMMMWGAIVLGGIAASWPARAHSGGYNNDVIPTFEAHAAKIETVLSDNGREFCGRPDQHPYELFLQLEEIAN